LTVFATEIVPGTAAGLKVHEEERDSGPTAIDTADPGIVSLQSGLIADMGFTEKFGMIGYGRKVERAGQLDLTHGTTIVSIGLQSQALTAGKAVRICWPIDCTHCTRIQRKGSVYVQISKIGLAQGGIGGALFRLHRGLLCLLGRAFCSRAIRRYKSPNKQGSAGEYEYDEIAHLASSD
jgi:hypothetical protein